MARSFLYDTHYQLDKPLALLDLTMEVAAPGERASDDSMARRLVRRAAQRKIRIESGPGEWRINTDAMKYWLDNCHETALLSRQNAYDYWLMNFIWTEPFKDGRECWGELTEEREEEVRLLLLRWGWIFDGAMLATLCWTRSRGDAWEPGKLVSDGHVERMILGVLGALRETSADPREQARLRLQIEEIRRRQFKYNTRRHKLLTHWGILADAGVIDATASEGQPPGAFADLLVGYKSASEVARTALVGYEIGPGWGLFLGLVRAVFGYRVGEVADLDESGWEGIKPLVRAYWRKVQAWDRKFLGISALAELFVVKNILSGTAIWPLRSWQAFLSQRARTRPEELTVHVDRFGRVEYLRLAS